MLFFNKSAIHKATWFKTLNSFIFNILEYENAVIRQKNKTQQVLLTWLAHSSVDFNISFSCQHCYIAYGAPITLPIYTWKHAMQLVGTAW